MLRPLSRYAGAWLLGIFSWMPPAFAEQGTVPVIDACYRLYQQRLAHSGVQGVPVLRLTITESGDVADAQVIQSSGRPELDEIAARCVEGWHYKPAVKDGKPTTALLTIALMFHLRSRPSPGWNYETAERVVENIDDR